MAEQPGRGVLKIAQGRKVNVAMRIQDLKRLRALDRYIVQGIGEGDLHVTALG